MTPTRHFWQTRPSANKLGDAEEWRTIPSCSRYQASSWGRIMGPRGHIKSPQTDKDGYETYGIFDGERQRTKKGHRMVCEAFNGPAPEARPFVAHIDGNPTNNRPSNLMWATARENYHHMRAHGTEVCGEKHYWAKLSREQVKEIWLSKEASGRIAKRMGLSKSGVTSIRTMRTWVEFTKTLPEQPMRAGKTKLSRPCDLDEMFRQGMTLRQMAQRYGVSAATVLRWSRQGVNA